MGDGSVVRGTPPLREEVDRPRRTIKKGRGCTPLHFQHIAHRGACRKTQVVPHNRWPRPEPTEMGDATCVLLSMYGSRGDDPDATQLVGAISRERPPVPA